MTSETDAEFLDSMEQWVIGSLVFKREHRDRLFALARRGAADAPKGFTAGWVTGRADAAKVANEMFWEHTNGKFDSFNGDPTWTAGDHGAYIASTIEAAIRTLPPPPAGEMSDGDLVERLRGDLMTPHQATQLMDDAADRIEKLDAALREIVGWLEDPEGGSHEEDMREASRIARAALGERT